MPPEAQAVLDFWFAGENAARWYALDPAFDLQIREHFGTLADIAATGELDHWTQTPSGWLALLIVLDQFSRNLHRNDARAWAQDVKAQHLALSGIAKGEDRRLPPLHRVFAYMPLEHAENMDLQRRSVELFEILRDDTSSDQRARFDDFLVYARKHRDVIERFGRFPHRNAVLGRASTSEEIRYLSQPGASF